MTPQGPADNGAHGRGGSGGRPLQLVDVGGDEAADLDHRRTGLGW